MYDEQSIKATLTFCSHLYNRPNWCNSTFRLVTLTILQQFFFLKSEVSAQVKVSNLRGCQKLEPSLWAKQLRVTKAMLSCNSM